jgi:hypothetical protein
VTLSDEEYDRVMATIARWRAAPQPSYDLGSHNCVHFVGDLARSLGMAVDNPQKLMKRPRSYLEHLSVENHDWLAAHHAAFWRNPKPDGSAKPLARPQPVPQQPLRVPSS